MKTVLAVAVLVFVSQAHGYSSGRDVSVNVKGNATKLCQDCLNFFTDIQEMISSPNFTAQVEQLVDQMVCANFGSFEGMCKEVADQLIPEALGYLAGMEDPRQTCGILGFCTQKALKLVTMPVPRKQVRGETCDLCKTAVNELKDMIRNQQDQCKQEVKTYAGMVFQLLENELEPLPLCQELGLCPQTKMVSLTRIGLTSSSTKVKVIKPQGKVASSAECILCEFAMKYLDQILGNNRTQASIEAALDQLCDMLPSTLTQQCTSFVKTYGPAIINLLLQELNPDQICTQLGLCTSAKKIADPDPACFLCEYVMSEVEKLLANNKSEANVEAAMQKVCGLVPVTISVECKQFVQDFGPAIINLLVKELNPKDVCSTLKLCTGNKAIKAVKMTHPRVEKKLSASPECILCEFAMKELDTLLSDNRTENNVMAALDKVCSRLSDTVRDECTTFVNTYSPAIIDLLIQELDPQQICRTLGLCPGSNVRKVTPLKGKLRGELCDDCVIVFNYVDMLLKDNATAQDIQMVLDKVCNFLGKELKSQCDAIVNEYAPLIIDLIANDLNPREICEELKLCNASRKAMELRDNKLYFKAGLLGKDKCTYGPSYWCSSKENAARCGAVEHCRKHVWN